MDSAFLDTAEVWQTQPRVGLGALPDQSLQSRQAIELRPVSDVTST
jgi:hypothetical protein